MSHTASFYQSALKSCCECKQPGGSDQSATDYLEIKELETTGDRIQIKASLLKHLSHRKIVWIKKGEGKLFIDFEQHMIQDNTVYFVEPGQLYIFQQDCNITGQLISFSANLINPASEYSILHASLASYNASRLSTSLNDSSHEQIESILNMLHKNSTARPEILACLLEILLFYLKRNCKIYVSQFSHMNCTGLAKHFHQLVYENSNIKKNVVDYASEMAVSPGYLNEVIKQSSGRTASCYIQNTISLEAMRQAVYFGRSIKELSDSLGFDDISYFSKFFKRNIGMTFREFKANIRVSMNQLHPPCDANVAQKRWSLL